MEGNDLKIENRSTRPLVVVITNHVNEKDPIPPLPMWTNVSFNSVDYPIKRKLFDRMFMSDYVNTHENDTKLV